MRLTVYKIISHKEILSSARNIAQEIFNSSKWSMGFHGGSDGKESACNAGDLGSIPRSGRFPGGEGMTTHSNILAWKIPWIEEPGGLQSMGSQRVGHDRSDLAHT